MISTLMTLTMISTRNDNNKIGHSQRGFFGQINHYDNEGNKTGESVRDFWGGYNHYEEVYLCDDDELDEDDFDVDDFDDDFDPEQ